MITVSRLAARAAALAAFALAALQPALSAELLMFRRAGCPYCLTWDRVIGPIYPVSDLGRRAPVRMVDLGRDSPPQAKLDLPVYYTPTFILIEDGREVGRIEGYPGEDFFWGLLETLVRKLPPPDGSPTTIATKPAPQPPR